MSAQRGVVSAEFNLASSEVSIEYLIGATEAKTLRRAIEEFGYRVREISGSGNEGTSEDALAKAHADEYGDLLRRFVVASILSLPVLLIAMSHGRIPALNFPGVNYLQLALTVPVVPLLWGALLSGRVGGVPPSRRRYEHAYRSRYRRGVFVLYCRDYRPSLVRCRKYFPAHGGNVRRNRAGLF